MTGPIELKPITAESTLEQVWINLDAVVRYGLQSMDRLDAEKIVTAHTLIEMLRKAQVPA
jgi:hypothetical protein